jgi:hypothetical protein
MNFENESQNLWVGDRNRHVQYNKSSTEGKCVSSALCNGASTFVAKTLKNRVFSFSFVLKRLDFSTRWNFLIFVLCFRFFPPSLSKWWTRGMVFVSLSLKNGRRRGISTHRLSVRVWMHRPSVDRVRTHRQWWQSLNTQTEWNWEYNSKWNWVTLFVSGRI